MFIPVMSLIIPCYKTPIKHSLQTACLCSFLFASLSIVCIWNTWFKWSMFIYLPRFSDYIWGVQKIWHLPFLCNETQGDKFFFFLKKTCSLFTLLWGNSFLELHPVNMEDMWLFWYYPPPHSPFSPDKRRTLYLSCTEKFWGKIFL